MENAELAATTGVTATDGLEGRVEGGLAATTGVTATEFTGR